MIFLLIAVVTLLASMAGAVCGIGGGVVIKPVLDSLGIMDVSAVSFLSGCTVLCMTAYTVMTNLKSKKIPIRLSIAVPMSLGAAVGGIIGKSTFQFVKSAAQSAELVGIVQAGCLFLLTLGTLLYTVNKKRIRTKQMKHTISRMMVGFLLGVFSSFLGIGGGPFNLVFLSFFFSMETKEAVQTSLFIILFSQITSLCSTIMTRHLPNVDLRILIIMAAMGILGAVFGKKVNSRLSVQMVDGLFVGIILFIMGICVYNMLHMGWKPV